MASAIVNFPYNSLGVARLDSSGVVHNHMYHECPVGRVDTNNIIHNDPVNNSPIGRVDANGIIHNHPINHFPVGRVDKDGYVYDNKNAKVARVEGEDYLKAGSAFLLLINELRYFHNLIYNKRTCIKAGPYFMRIPKNYHKYPLFLLQRNFY